MLQPHMEQHTGSSALPYTLETPKKGGLGRAHRAQHYECHSLIFLLM